MDIMSKTEKRPLAQVEQIAIAMTAAASAAKDIAQIAAIGLEMRRRFYAGDVPAEQYSGWCDACSVEFWIGHADACPICGSELLPF